MSDVPLYSRGASKLTTRSLWCCQLRGEVGPHCTARAVSTRGAPRPWFKGLVLHSRPTVHRAGHVAVQGYLVHETTPTPLGPP